MENLSLDLILYSPEIIIAMTLCFTLIIQIISKNKSLTFLTALAGLIISAYASLRLNEIEPQTYFSNLLSHDPFSLFFRCFFILATFFTFLFSFRSHEISENRHSEFYLMTLAVLIGMTTLVSSINILSLYLSLELVSIVSYALAGLRYEHPASNEAAIKYLLYGALASGTMLWGLSLLYGLTGTLNLYLLKAALSSSYIDTLSLHAIFIMLLFGFGFKMAFVPFHMWAPDVYHGAPTPTAAFFTVAPKAAGFAIFIRFFYTVFVNPIGDGAEWVWYANLNWPLFLSILSALTMTLGNLSALFQNRCNLGNLKEID